MRPPRSPSHVAAGHAGSARIIRSPRLPVTLLEKAFLPTKRKQNLHTPSPNVSCPRNKETPHCLAGASSFFLGSPSGPKEGRPPAALNPKLEVLALPSVEAEGDAAGELQPNRVPITFLANSSPKPVRFFGDQWWFKKTGGNQREA